MTPTVQGQVQSRARAGEREVPWRKSRVLGALVKRSHLGQSRQDKHSVLAKDLRLHRASHAQLQLLEWSRPSQEPAAPMTGPVPPCPGCWSHLREQVRGRSCSRRDGGKLILPTPRPRGPGSGMLLTPSGSQHPAGGSCTPGWDRDRDRDVAVLSLLWGFPCGGSARSPMGTSRDIPGGTRRGMGHRGEAGMFQRVLESCLGQQGPPSWGEVATPSTAQPPLQTTLFCSDI